VFVLEQQTKTDTGNDDERIEHRHNDTYEKSDHGFPLFWTSVCLVLSATWRTGCKRIQPLEWTPLPGVL
jgi:hypothetical protein